MFLVFFFVFFVLFFRFCFFVLFCFCVFLVARMGSLVSNTRHTIGNSGVRVLLVIETVLAKI